MVNHPISPNKTWENGAKLEKSSKCHGFWTYLNILKVGNNRTARNTKQTKNRIPEFRLGTGTVSVGIITAPALTRCILGKQMKPMDLEVKQWIAFHIVFGLGEHSYLLGNVDDVFVSFWVAT